MSKKDFVALAAALASTKPSRKGAALETWLGTVAEVSRVCRESSPNFNKERFLTACGCDK